MREYPSADAVRFAPRTSCIFIRSYTTSPVTVAPATGLRFYLIRQSAAKKQAKKHHHKQDNDHSPHTASPFSGMRCVTAHWGQNVRKRPSLGYQERQRWDRKFCQAWVVEKMDRDAPKKVKAHEKS